MQATERRGKGKGKGRGGKTRRLKRRHDDRHIITKVSTILNDKDLT
jgi:hypothetical protein